MKKGISLVALVITIVVLVILTGAVIITTIDSNIMGNTQTTVDMYNKKAIIEDINMKIQTEKLKKVNQGIYKLIMTDILPIIQTYGNFDNTTLKLTTTTTTKPIEIWLYEIMNIPLEEYTTISYINNILTITTQLPSDLYRVQYTTNGGTSWELYNSPVTIAQESGIQIRLLNTEGTVVSNTLKITNGYVEEIDNTNPSIRIEPNGIGLAKEMQVTITVTDDNELATNTYEYCLIQSQEAPEDSSSVWIEKENGEKITIGTGLTGTYYLHVKSVSDVAGNISGNVVSESYYFDNTLPTASATISKVSEGVYTATMNISDNKELDLTKCYYAIRESSSELGDNIDNYDNVFGGNNKTINFGICGNYYLHILATDTLGNTKEYVSAKLESGNADYGTVETETTYSYMNSIQEVNLTAGVYKMEVWGAAGGGTYGGQGGYSTGMIQLQNSQNIFIATGGKGIAASGTTGGAGGYNGGGKGGKGYSSYSGGSGGGGATHIATATGILSSLSNNNISVLIVAGGGGGDIGTWGTYSGGVGGGSTGGTGKTLFETAIAAGTQTTGYSFGQGQNARNGASANGGAEGAGGGGSGYFGGYAQTSTGTDTNASGAGGSGYISTVLINARTEQGEGSTGDGYAKITKYNSGYQYLTSLPIVPTTKQYLYNEGEQYVDITGGWSNYTVPGTSGHESITNSGTVHETATFNETNIVLYAPASNYNTTSCCARTNNMVDVTNYDKLYVKCNLNGNHYGHAFFIVTKPNLTCTYTWVAQNSPSASKSEYGDVGDIVLELDISAVTGSQYLFLQTTGWQWGSSQGPYYCTATIYEVWME